MLADLFAVAANGKPLYLFLDELPWIARSSPRFFRGLATFAWRLTDSNANARVNGHANRHRLNVSRQQQNQRIGAYPSFVKRLHRILVGATLDEQLTLETQPRRGRLVFLM
jgi:hypothetical protein